MSIILTVTPPILALTLTVTLTFISIGRTALHESVREAPEERVWAKRHESAFKAVLTVMVEALGIGDKSVDIQDDEGNTAMHYAAYKGLVEAVNMLHDAGGDPYIKNKADHSPFELLSHHLDELEQKVADHEARSETRDSEGSFVVGTWSASDVVSWIRSINFGKLGDIERYARTFASTGLYGLHSAVNLDPSSNP